ncbi:MAG: bifunctional methylenetetrahydrofolate dehydrogenase/methenyltetrahydrofolate cyclohydrolase FolD [Bacteroidales bacterium]|nr:bifunctional methylenetetrahydrofolate dehydrogenase/methenyltetrahydrofolate cyclohydrolase FolD [Bacteroidales bacterium]HOY39247.1 bifunctional methylenetetrahydrofolate dehydrogenase/methenyltetrahydrofolate cyclohydrolase FolD [Bacteroidales bacterium]
MQIIDGKKISEDIYQELYAETEKIKESGARVPHLAAIIVGNNAASETYVANKEKACTKVGFDSTLIRYPENTSQPELLCKIQELNTDNGIDGLIVQLPLPAQFNEQQIIEAIHPEKDVDGFHPINLGKMVIGMPSYISATPLGIIELLKRYHIDTEGKHCVVIGRSNIVGKPISILMSRNTYPGNATVTVCHSKTNNLKDICLSADILIVAIGKPNYLKADMVANGAVVIDVGINRVPSDKTKSGFALVGDVAFDEVAPKCSFITPVPGGVGLMTVASLLLNTMKSYKNKQ